MLKRQRNIKSYPSLHLTLPLLGVFLGVLIQLADWRYTKKLATLIPTCYPNCVVDTDTRETLILLQQVKRTFNYVGTNNKIFLALGSWLSLTLIFALFLALTLLLKEQRILTQQRTYLGENKTFLLHFKENLQTLTLLITGLFCGAQITGQIINQQIGLSDGNTQIWVGPILKTMLILIVLAAISPLLVMYCNQQTLILILPWTVFASAYPVLNLPFLTGYTPAGLTSDFIAWPANAFDTTTAGLGTLTPGKFSSAEAGVFLTIIIGVTVLLAVKTNRERM